MRKFHVYLIWVYLTVFSMVMAEEATNMESSPEEFDVQYVTPTLPQNAYFAETFDDVAQVDKAWIKSKAKKDGVDDEIAKYDGEWGLEPMKEDAMEGDLGLVLKSKAKHAAISSSFNRPFVFKDKPLVVQYEVNLQNGQDCGGSYIKLLSHPKKGSLDLEKFHDKTPYTIMFGPDKCGNDYKFHFIFRHVNPINGNIEEKHCKRPDSKVEEPFKDKKPHLYTLIIQPDNTFRILVDHDLVNKGNLFEDFTPSVNPPKEIDDPKDFKPNDWDEREKIPDPIATKPDDWDENEPMKIVDEHAEMPEGWLEHEPKLIPDPEAEKPSDWDNQMDGEWEAPLINNPACDNAPGCGEWTAPTIDNPKYKGKWVAPMIDNPNYKGKWSPRKINNPDYFEDLEPFKMTSIGAIGLEIWSMSDNIYFDNIIVTDSLSDAKEFAARTFDLKMFKINKGMSTMWGKVRKSTNNKPWWWLSYILYCVVPLFALLVFIGRRLYQKGMFQQIIDYSNENPWMYAVYVLMLAVPVVLVFVCCCAEDSKEISEADKKKTDEPTEDDPAPEEEKSDGNDENNESETNDEEVTSEKEDPPASKSPRLRRARKD